MITKPCKLNDPVIVQKLVDEYFTEREEAQEVRELKSGDKRVYRTPPSVLGLSKKLGISHDSFYRYCDEDSPNYSKEICNILTYAKERISQELLEGIQMGYWNEKVTMAQLQKYGYLGSFEEDKTVKVVIQGSPDWSK